jgi:hypothetical protein
MGPAVWNGGFSTFLAFVLLVNTDSHIFTTFFKVSTRIFGSESAEYDRIAT